MRAQKTAQMAEIALMSAVLCVISPFAIPVPMSPVPLSLSTFAVYVTALILGARKGAVCILIYLFLGIVGLPVFSGFSGGIGVLVGPTGGYLIGYLVCVVVTGLSTEAAVLKKCFGKRQFLQNVFSMVLGTLSCYVPGTVWFLFVMEGTWSLGQVLLVCVVPYLTLDMMKIFVAATLAPLIKKALVLRIR